MPAIMIGTLEVTLEVRKLVTVMVGELTTQAIHFGTNGLKREAVLQRELPQTCIGVRAD